MLVDVSVDMFSDLIIAVVDASAINETDNGNNG